jgi:hypothetical protein
MCGAIPSPFREKYIQYLEIQRYCFDLGNILLGHPSE